MKKNRFIFLSFLLTGCLTGCVSPSSNPSSHPSEPPSETQSQEISEELSLEASEEQSEEQSLEQSEEISVEQSQEPSEEESQEPSLEQSEELSLEESEEVSEEASMEQSERTSESTGIDSLEKLSSALDGLTDGEQVVLQKDAEFSIGYDFCDGENVAFLIENKKNITIDGNGATVRLFGNITPLIFSNCENVLLKNLNVEFSNVSLGSVKVLSVDGRELELEIPDGVNFSIEDKDVVFTGNRFMDETPDKFAWKDDGVVCFYYNADVKKFEAVKFSGGTPTLPVFTALEQTGERTVSATLKSTRDADAFSEGTVLYFIDTNADASLSVFENCKGVAVENLSSSFIAGTPIRAIGSETVSIKNCTFQSDTAPSYCSTGLTFTDCGGELSILSCTVQNGVGDGVYATNLLYTVKEVLSDTSVNVTAPCKAFSLLDENAPFEFISPDTLLPFYGATLLTKTENQDGSFLLTFDRPHGLSTGDLVENLKRKADLKIKDCTLKNCYGTGVSVAVRGKAELVGNTFSTLSSSAVKVLSDAEKSASGYKQDTVISDNTFSLCGYEQDEENRLIFDVLPSVRSTAFSGYVLRSLDMKNNVFSGGEKCKVSHTRHVSVSEKDKKNLTINILTETELLSFTTFGDSITVGTYLSTPTTWSVVENNYTKLVSEKIHATTTTNIGLNGRLISATEVPEASQEAFYRQSAMVNQASSIKGDVIVVAMGTNDFGMGVELGTNRDKTDVSFYGAVDVAFSKLKEANWNAQIYVVLPIPRRDENVPKNKMSDGSLLTYVLDDYRSALQEKAVEYGFAVIDGSELDLKTDTTEYLVFDDVHPNPAGHRLYAQLIYQEIEKHLSDL